MSFFKLEDRVGFEILSDSIGKIIGYVETDINEASGVAPGWSIQMENRCGLGFNVTDELIGTRDVAKQLLEHAHFIDKTLERAREEPRFIAYLPDGKKEELPIFEIDTRSLDERIEAVRRVEEANSNIFSILREALVK